MIKELEKERILCRKENPVRAKVLGILLAEAKGFAKEMKREPEIEDVELSAKRNAKTIRSLISDVRDMPREQIEQLQGELICFESFAPKMLSKEQTLSVVLLTLSSIETEDRIKKNFGKFMGIIKKSHPYADMKVAADLLKEQLK